MPPAAEVLAQIIKQNATSVPNAARQPDSPILPRGVGDTLYDPIELEKHEIRLLTIQPSANFDEEISCTLSKAFMRDGLRFTALSYVWGDPKVTEPITVNGKRVQVTTNLASALRHIRHTGVQEVLDAFWVDAICIDQKNLKEKTHHVQLMSELYRNATLVISWLGLEANNSTVVIDTFTRIANALRKAESEHDRSLGWFREFPGLWRTLSDSITQQERMLFISAVNALKARDFFQRGWIYQESILPRSRAFMCALEAGDAKDFLLVSKFFSSIQTYTKPDFVEQASWEFLLTFAWTWNFDYSRSLPTEGTDVLRFDLPTLILATSRHKVSDPRDKIYSLMGLSEDEVLVDYEASTADVYVHVAKLWLQKSDDLEFLMYTGKYETKKTDPNLPSWCPDWHAISLENFLPLGLKDSAVSDSGP
jgi:hypothetical protein